MNRKLAAAIASPGLCVLLLAAMVAEARTRIQPADADPFHHRAREAIEGFPATMDGGQWVSKDQNVGPEATKLLRPNAILSRRYVKHSTNGQPFSADLLIVQCRDARDMQGHYPPRCYPANGSTLVQHLPRTWNIGGMSITGTEYFFSQPVAGMNEERRIYNFFVIPEIPGLPARSVRGICPDIDSVYKSGEDYQRRYYGAAQFQLVFSNDLSQGDRDEVMAELLGPNLNVIRTLMNDGSADKASGPGMAPPDQGRAPAGAAPANAESSPAAPIDPAAELNTGGIRP